MKNSILTFILLLSATITFAQGYSHYENSQFDFYQRQMYRPGDKKLHSSLRNYKLDELNAVFNTDSVLYDGISVPDKKMNIFRRFLHGNTLEWRDNDIAVAINPYCNFQFGKDGSASKYVNSRGFTIDGNITKNFWFYMDFTENQATYPEYIESLIDQYRTVPGEAARKKNKYDNDFQVGNGYIAFNFLKYFDLQLGKGKTFIGDGYRSLMLSDVAPSYPMIKLNATFWNVKYMFMISQLRTHDNQGITNNGYLVKYAVTHYLDWNLWGRFSLGIFENVTMANRNLNGDYRSFDFEYLNPFVVLRTSEFDAGSPDKMLIGINSKFVATKWLTLYGQIVLNEFIAKELFSHSKVWNNKYAFQLGAKTFNLFGVKNLDIQAEYNHARPYMYTQYDALAPYTHQEQPLAHPLGANFKEYVAIANYKYKRLMVRGQINTAQYGADIDTVSYGHDIRKPTKKNYSIVSPITTGDGLKTDLTYADGSISFLINPRSMFNITVGGRYRKLKDSNHTEESKHIYFAVRWSLKNFYYDF